MHPQILLKFVISISTVPILFYLVIKTLLAFKYKITIYYSIFIGLLGVSMLLYSYTPLLVEGQTFLAEITFGGSLVLIVMGTAVYMEYIQTMYKRFKSISNIFYIALGLTIAIIIWGKPWIIYFSDEWNAYTQIITDELLISTGTLILCMITMFSLALNRIKQRLYTEIARIKKTLIILSDESKENVSIVKSKQQDYEGKIRSINIILGSFFVAMILGMIGMAAPVLVSLDAIAVLILVIPQAIIFTRDKSLLVLLLAQKIEESATNLKRDVSLLQQQLDKATFAKADIASLIDFIERADFLLHLKEFQESEESQKK